MSKNIAKGLADLKEILPENQAGLAKAARSADIPNLSTQVVEETPPFNSEAHAAAFLAQAGMQSEHLNLTAAALPGGGAESITRMRNELAPLATELRGLRLPDTRVNIEGIKMEVPFELKQYANDLDQEKYNKIMFALLGKERMADFRKHTTRANQNTTPALWLNQAICVETKKPYVFLISRNLAEALKEKGLDNVSAETDATASNYLQIALGSTLWGSIANIANVNQMPLYTVFVAIVDEILHSRNITAAPVTASSLWDEPSHEVAV